jgi:hypothetical protein
MGRLTMDPWAIVVVVLVGLIAIAAAVYVLKPDSK